MEILALKENDYSLGDLKVIKEKTLIVEMTQEEYQKCCAVLYKNEQPNLLGENLK